MSLTKLKTRFRAVFEFDKIEKHVFELVLSLTKLKTRFRAVFEFDKIEKDFFELF